MAEQDIQRISFVKVFIDRKTNGICCLLRFITCISTFKGLKNCKNSTSWCSYSPFLFKVGRNVNKKPFYTFYTKKEHNIYFAKFVVFSVQGFPRSKYGYFYNRDLLNCFKDISSMTSGIGVIDGFFDDRGSNICDVIYGRSLTKKKLSFVFDLCDFWITILQFEKWQLFAFDKVKFEL